MIHNILQSKGTRLFIVLAGFFITNALVAEVIGVKIFSLEDTLGIPRAAIPIFGSPFSFHLTAGVLLWPVVFIMTDIINEYYGPRAAKLTVYIGLVSRDKWRFHYQQHERMIKIIENESRSVYIVEKKMFQNLST
jgi:uncharacterized PurR-regulated membrane protein YhhQ (DUF165 family)